MLARTNIAFNVAAKSDIGCHREKNEDAFFVDSANGLYIVCDGLGGHLAGEIASQKAIEYIVAFVNKAKAHRILPAKAEVDFRKVWTNLLVEAIEDCCDQLCELAESSPELEGMATTVTALLIAEDVAFVGHLGDSRLYLKQGAIAKQLTSDHTLLNEFANLFSKDANSKREPIAVDRFKHILTRCAGRERDFDVETFSFQLIDKDVLLMCTDGLSNYLMDETTIVNFLDDPEVEKIASSLIDFANTQGGQDNITAIVIRVLSNTIHQPCSQQEIDKSEVADCG